MLTYMFSALALVAASTLAFADDYSITVNSLGIGNTWSKGHVTPLHVSVSTTATKATQAWIQWEVPDADGDIVLWGKPITVSPGTNATTWLYAPIQPWADGSIAWTIRLRTMLDGEPTSELARLRFTSNSINASPIHSKYSLIGVVGTRRMGLEGYLPFTPPDPKQEGSVIVSGLVSADLPDAWPCYESLETLVWADRPPLLTIKQETAIEQWVERGGNVVVTLPTIGDPWNLDGENGPLGALLSGITTSVQEIPLSQLGGILGRDSFSWPSTQITARVLKASSEYVSILKLQNNSVVGVQKNVGFGSVTVIGIDLSSGLLSSLGLPETDVLWRRVLGKRGDTPSQQTVNALKENGRLTTSLPTVTSLSLGNMVAQEIAMSSAAGGRLGTVFVIISLYWLLSCPVAFFVLRRKKKQRWAWMAFAGIAAIFAGVTWVLAATSASVSTPIKHVSVIDHVYGESGQRVIGWYSLFLPTFGSSNVALEGEQGNLLLPWSSPDASLTPPFVDTREVAVQLSNVPNSFNQPSRATTANFAYEWLGGLDNEFYGSLIRVKPGYEPNDVNGALQGTIVNNASRELQDVTIIWVTGNKTTLAPLARMQDNSSAPWYPYNQSGSALNKTYTWRLADWPSRDTLDLSLLQPNRESEFDVANDRYIPKTTNRILWDSHLSKSDWRHHMEMLTLYSSMPQPFYMKKESVKQSKPFNQFTRSSGRELDLADWFGRPCIIVMGFMPHAPIPVKISVDGEEITKSTGETFVRWVYPLGDVHD